MSETHQQTRKSLALPRLISHQQFDVSANLECRPRGLRMEMQRAREGAGWITSQSQPWESVEQSAGGARRCLDDSVPICEPVERCGAGPQPQDHSLLPAEGGPFGVKGLRESMML